MGQLCGWWLLCGLGHEQRRDPIYWPHALYFGTHNRRAIHWAEHLCTGLCLHFQFTISAHWCFQLTPGSSYQIRSEAKSQGTLLPDHHPYVKLIKRIGLKIAQKASDDSGVSGHMEHMKVRYDSCGSLSRMSKYVWCIRSLGT